uniref:Uncharacterized protein n=1 Tax=Anguilla anguilla TaxID=7936 RepID=A0A0E9Y243_ANGAN
MHFCGKWENIPQQQTQSLSDSMQQRYQKVVAARDGHTHYLSVTVVKFKNCYWFSSVLQSFAYLLFIYIVYVNDIVYIP